MWCGVVERWKRWNGSGGGGGGRGWLPEEMDDVGPPSTETRGTDIAAIDYSTVLFCTGLF